MTTDQAYIEGFCKAAEAVGVDPVALYKRAGARSMIFGVLSRIRKPLAAVGSRIANSRVGQAVANSRYGELMRGGSNPVRGAFRLGKADLSSMGNLRGWANAYWQGLSGKMGPEAAAERRKVLAARAATGAGGIAALRGVGSAFGSSDAD